MDIISKLRDIRRYKVLKLLVYDEGVRRAYNTVSVCGDSLAGKTVVITGGSGGIGFATAQRFFKEGSDVIITGRNEAKLKKACSALCDDNDNGRTVDYILLDQLKPNSFVETVNKIFERGNVDVWVNCAGIFTQTDRSRRFREVDTYQYHNVINTNFKSNLVLVPIVANKMLEQSIDGVIINVSSIAGVSNHYGYTPYGISKSGLIEYTKQISNNKSNISIISVAPGSVATDMSSTGFGHNIAGTSSFNRRYAIPEEIAAVLAFLSGKISHHINGQTILVGGGEII